MNRTVAAYVRSPFQLDCLIEATSHEQKKDIILFLEINYHNKIAREQFINLLNSSEWKEVVRIRASNNLLFHIDLCMALIRVFLLKPCLLYIGQFKSSLSHIFIVYSRVEDVILLDDGAATIDVVYNFLNNNKQTFVLDNIKDKYRYKFFSLFVKRKKLVYKLYSKFKFGSEIVNLHPTIDTENKAKLSGVVYYFGSKFVETKAVGIENELLFLSKVFTNLSCLYSSVCYIPHREESYDKLLEVEKIGFTLNKLNLPAESYFSQAEFIPCAIASCWSTVLWTLPQRYDFDEVVCFDNLHILERESDFEKARVVYDYYAKNGLICTKV